MAASVVACNGYIQTVFNGAGGNGRTVEKAVMRRDFNIVATAYTEKTLTVVTHDRELCYRHKVTFDINGWYVVNDDERRQWRLNANGLLEYLSDDNYPWRGWTTFDTFHQVQWSELVKSWLADIALLHEEHET